MIIGRFGAHTEGSSMDAKYKVYLTPEDGTGYQNVYGVFACSTRKELADLVRDAIFWASFPANVFADAKIRRKWGFIKRYGSSSAHFNLYYKDQAIVFEGMTDDEYEAANRED